MNKLNHLVKSLDHLIDEKGTLNDFPKVRPECEKHISEQIGY